MGITRSCSTANKMMASPCLVVALSLFIAQSEACIPTQPPPATTAAAAATTTGAPTTTAKPLDCPLDGKTCVAEGNVLELKSADGPEKCNTECAGNEKCTQWTYTPTRKLCFLLSSCTAKDEAGIISGDKGCKIPSKKITVFNLTGKSAKTVKVEWESNCADEEIAEIATLKSQDVSYFESPDSLKCGKIKAVTGKMDTVDCTALATTDVSNVYIKTKSDDAAACVIETNAKNAN